MRIATMVVLLLLLAVLRWAASTSIAGLSWSIDWVKQKGSERRLSNHRSAVQFNFVAFQSIFYWNSWLAGHPVGAFRRSKRQNRGTRLAPTGTGRASFRGRPGSSPPTAIAGVAIDVSLNL